MTEEKTILSQGDEDEYAAILRFATEKSGISYTAFDACTVKELNLFALRESLNFELLEETLDKIIAALPALKHIFARPIMRLKDINELLPVESVHVINNHTLSYASVHSETWSNVSDKDGVRPGKLLTLKHEDSYVTYENIGFAKAISIIFRFISRGIKQMTDVMFASRDMRFNLLERENHLSYFLAIGKLHVGYVHNYERYRAISKRCTQKMLFIDRTLSSRKNAPVYKSCKDKIDRFSLKKSTTFRVHKDYAQVYRLLKWFSETRLDMEETVSEQEETAPGYTAYCNLISLFAAGHFGFTFDEKPLDFLQLQAHARFRDFRLELRTLSVGKKKALLLSVKKEALYRILLLPDGRPEDLAKFRARCRAEEYLLTSHTDAKDGIYLSLFDIESFRRVQQLLLRAMVYADEKKDVCPFCGDKPEAISLPIKEKQVWECGACRMQTAHAVCPVTKEPYFATAVKGYLPPPLHFDATSKRERLLYRKQLESCLFFRNITPITQDGISLCPHCGKDHGVWE